MQKLSDCSYGYTVMSGAANHILLIYSFLKGIRFKLSFAFILLPSFYCFAQLATVETAGEQKSTFKSIGWGLHLFKSIDQGIRYFQFHETIESPDGYYKVGLNDNSGYQKKRFLSIHISKLDKKLQIVKEFDIELAVKDGSGYMRPFSLFKNGNKIELVGFQHSGNDLNVINWEFELSDFSTLKADNKLATFAVADKSYCEVLVDVNKTSNFFGLSIIERKGKKSKEAVLHNLSCNNSMVVITSKSFDLPLEYNEDILAGVETAANGDIWTLLDIRVKDVSSKTFLININKQRNHITEIKDGNDAVTQSAFTINSTGNTVLVSGFANREDKINSKLYVGELAASGELIKFSEYAFTESFVAKTTKLEKKLRDNNGGLSKNYYVRDIVIRNNNMVDVILACIEMEETVTPIGLGYQKATRSKSGDIIIVSITNKEVVSSICINRNLFDLQAQVPALSLARSYQIPFVYANKNDLMMIFVGNNSSLNSQNLDGVRLSQGTVLAVKIDDKFKVSKQVIYDLKESIEGFDTFGDIFFMEISKGQMLAYRETIFGLSAKAKLTFSLIKFK